MAKVRALPPSSPTVMAVLVTAIHAHPWKGHIRQWIGGAAWMAGARPAMTKVGWYRPSCPDFRPSYPR